MSDVVRNYSSTVGSRPRSRRRGLNWRHGLLLAAAAALAVLAWMVLATRDTHRIEELIPADQRYMVHVRDFLTMRERIARSRVWDLTEGTEYASAPAQITSDFGLPEWVLNNLFLDSCYLSGRDSEGFGDPLFVTRMSRVGCLLERFHFVSGEVNPDPAGGLSLRAIPEAGIYYAVRGRILAISPSREALIRALTRGDGGHASPDALAALQSSANGAALEGSMQLAPGAPLAAYFEQLRFALRTAGDGASLVLMGTPQPEWRARLSLLLANARPKALTRPPQGSLAIAADFGLTLPELWTALDHAFGESADLAAALRGMRAYAPGGHREWVSLADGLVAASGAEFALAWKGIDQHAMLPMPRIVASARANGGQVRSALESVPPPPEGLPRWAAYPRVDLANARAYLPLIGGPAIEPAAAYQNGRIIFSLSHPVVDEQLASGLPEGATSKEVNLYARLMPLPLLESLLETARQLAETGLIRGHDTESLETMAAPWLERAAKVGALELLAGQQGNELEFELRIQMGS